MPTLLLLFVGVACAAYSGVVAGSKGHNEIWWALGGLLLGPLALLAVVGLPDLKTRQWLRRLAGEQDEPQAKKSGAGKAGAGFWD